MQQCETEHSHDAAVSTNAVPASDSQQRCFVFYSMETRQLQIELAPLLPVVSLGHVSPHLMPFLICFQHFPMLCESKVHTSRVVLSAFSIMQRFGGHVHKAFISRGPN